MSARLIPQPLLTWARGARSMWPALLLAAALLPSTAVAGVVSLANLPSINQHNPVFDRNAQDGNQNGEYWCAPVASVAALLWLADHYNRPDIVPRDAAGKRYSTDAFVKYLGERWFNTNDKTGTGEQQWQSGLWGYLQTTPYQWRMNVYVDPGRLTELDGPSYFAHATVDDLYGQMRSGEDSPEAVALMAYQHTNALGDLYKHATVLQQLSDELDAAKRYPGKIMDPYFGRLDDVEFEAIKGMDSSANVWDAIAWRDAYLVMTIAPVPEPGALPLVGLAMLVLTASRRYPEKRHARGL